MKRQLMLVMPGVLTDKQKTQLRREVILVETDNFAAFKLIGTEFLLTSDAFAIAALETLCEKASWSSDEKFAKKILAAMKPEGTK